MRTMRLYFWRTLGPLFASPLANLGMMLFLAVSAFLFAHALEESEGTVASLPALWAVSAGWTLPALCALVTMRLIADDRRDGRLELILSASLSEVGYVVGRYLGAFLYVLMALGLYLCVPLFELSPFCTVATGLKPHLTELVPAFGGLVLQGALWCAVGTCMSACARHAALAAAFTFVFVGIVPRGLYALFFAWEPSIRASYPIFPGDLFLADMAAGLFVFSECMAFVAFALALLSVAVLAVRATRCVGRGSFMRRTFGLIMAVLEILFASFAVACCRQLDFRVEWPWGVSTQQFSARTQDILSGADGKTQVTCFLSKRDPAWRSTFALLHGLESAARVRGARLDVYVADPHWDVSLAAALVRSGVKEGSIVFERGARRIVVPVAELDEAACAAALQRLALPAERETVYWTTGHGEESFASYDVLRGMSTMARVLRRDGYVLKTFDAARATAVPDDCGVLVVAGARTVFSEHESALVEAYLRRGGRLLTFLSFDTRLKGLAALLTDWGITTLPYVVASPRTRDGTDVVVSEYGAHALTYPLVGCTTVFRSAVPFVSSVVTGRVDQTTYTVLAQSDTASWGESVPAKRPWVRDARTEPAGPFALAVALERGGAYRHDLAIRPTRIVAVGDDLFVTDSALVTRANANGDFIRNALAWLVGVDAALAPSTPVRTLVTGMDQVARKRFLLVAMGCGPLIVLLVGLLVSGYRRLR